MFDRDGNGKIDVVELCYMFQIEYRRKDGGMDYSKVFCIVSLHRTSSKELTFENLYQAWGRSCFWRKSWGKLRDQLVG